MSWKNTKLKWNTMSNLHILRTKLIWKLVQFSKFVRIFCNRTCILETGWAFGAQKREHKAKGDFWNTHSPKQTTSLPKKPEVCNFTSLQEREAHYELLGGQNWHIGEQQKPTRGNRSLKMGTADSKLGWWGLSIVPQLGFCPGQASKWQKKLYFAKDWYMTTWQCLWYF